nr:HAMP domain-containing methyl-accepting chemotaxis protein [Roseburia sp. 831b]
MAIGVVFILFLIGRLTGKIVKPLEELNGAAIELANGNFDVNIDVHSEDEVGELGNSIDKTVTRLKEYIDYIDYIDEISEVLANMADGKLAIHLKYAYVGEFQKVKDALNHISESMTDVMTNIVEGANQVSVGSDDLAKAAQSMAENTQTQAAAIEELLATATTVAEQVKENRDNSEKSASYTNEVADVMEDSKKQMAQMREAMDKIQESSQQVVGVIKAIEDIATQTNLLSLNASIEAARAGEAGKGFAVVAGEIGGLANESANAVNTTRELINVSLGEIEKGNAIVNDVITSLDEAVERVRVANGMIQDTAQMADTQMESIDQIRDGIDDMAQVVQDNSAMAEETSATSEELAAQSVTLNELVQRFELE